MSMATNESRGKRVAFLIGQKRFDRSEVLQPLQFPEADIDALSALLRGEVGTAYDAVQCFPSGDHHDASEALEDVLQELSSDDTVLVYYSGHGIVDRHNRLHLAFANTRDNRLSSTAFRISHLLDMLKSSNARARLLVLDCCFAGAIGSELNKDAGVGSQFQAESQGAGTVVLTATTGIDVAKESPEHGHGLFTYYFLEGIAGAADSSGDGTVTAQDLYDYVYAQLKTRGPQRPQRYNLATEGSIVVFETGRIHWQEEAEELRGRANMLWSAKQISDQMLTDMLALSRISPNEMALHEQARWELLRAVAVDTFAPGPFLDMWLLNEPPAGAEPRPERFPSDPAASEGAQEVKRERLPKTSESVPEIPTVPDPPRKVFSLPLLLYFLALFSGPFGFAVLVASSDANIAGEIFVFWGAIELMLFFVFYTRTRFWVSVVVALAAIGNSGFGLFLLNL